MQFLSLDKRTKTILIIQSIAMLMGTSTHVMWAIENGFFSENYRAPFTSVLFWDSLTFFDPLAAILLIFKPKWGLILTALIIGVDVIHNNIFHGELLYESSLGILEWFATYWMIWGQMLFAIFVYATLKGNLKSVNKIR